ncbi:MAG: thioredoxin family protein [Deltaproteobacteria bacterium]|nr:thioredoxin family protein [Deltaproteobacteria bacterium]
MSRLLDGSQVQTQTRVRAGLSYAYAYGDQPYNGATPEANPEQFKIRLQLAMLMAGIDLPGGFGAGLVVPSGRLRSSKLFGGELKATDDMGVGDVELRLRQDMNRLFDVQGRYLPRLVLSLGSGAPTGRYVSKRDLASGQPLDANLSLGRGVFWLLADAELFGPIVDRLGYYASWRTRTPVNNASDGFSWANEWQLSAGLTGQIVPRVLSMSASIDYLDRGMPTEIDYFGDRVDSVSIGGSYLDATVSARVQPLDNLAFDLTFKKQLRREVLGIQTPPAYWVFAGVSWNALFGDPPVAKRPALRPAQRGDAPQSDIAALLVAGKTTIVDYWATWCAPCLKLGPQLDAFVHGRADLALVKVDATEFDQAAMDRLLPDIAGLPVVDVYDKTGKLHARLCGEHAFKYPEFLPSDATPATP